MVRRGGRPPAKREQGSGQKLRLWFDITGRPLTYATKASKRLSPEKSERLPSLKALKQWMIHDIPVTELDAVAAALNVPVSYLFSHESLENFRTFVANQSDKSTLLPARVPPTGGQMIQRLAVLVQHNENIKRTLETIIHSAEFLSVDEIANKINASTIQLREILEGLMISGVIEVVTDTDFFSKIGPARMRLTAPALENRVLIESMINGSA